MRTFKIYSVSYLQLYNTALLTIVTMLYVQFSSVAQSYPTLCDPMNCNTPGLPVHHQLPEFTKLTSIESVMPSSHLILCRPLLLLPPIPPSIRLFSKGSTLCMRWPKYWSFSFSIIPSKEHRGLMLKLKIQSFGHLMQRADSLEKTLMLGKIEGRRRRDDRG